MKLSIITLTYGNRSIILHNCIESVLRNTQDIDFEYFIVDNNSGAKSRELIGRYARLPEFTWIKLDQNEGTPARNHGLDRAQGEYFAVVDDDVVITDTQWFQKMKEYLTEGVYAVGCEGANFGGWDNGNFGFGPANISAGNYCHFLTGYFVLYKNIRTEDGKPKYRFDPVYKSLRDESDLTNQALLDELKLKVCPKWCTHNSHRRWDEKFDSISKDTEYYINKWKPHTEKLFKKGE